MKHRTKKLLSYIITLAVIVTAGIWVASKLIHFGNVEFTDNARIQRQIVPVNSRVQGYIKEVRFKEYEPVKDGDTLVIIDDADMRLRLAQARADYQNALAGRTVADRSAANMPPGQLYGMIQQQAFVVSMKEIYGWLLIAAVVSLTIILVSYGPVRPNAIFPKWKTIRRIFRRESGAAY